jgi:DNA replication licensing factor MCM6
MSSPFPLPPSSAPYATSPADEGNSLPLGHTANLPILDPLGFTSNQVRDNSNGGLEEGAQRRVGRRKLREDLDSVPRVKDTTGEKVMERFASFLEKSVGRTCRLQG